MVFYFSLAIDSKLSELRVFWPCLFHSPHRKVSTRLLVICQSKSGDMSNLSWMLCRWATSSQIVVVKGHSTNICVTVLIADPHKVHLLGLYHSLCCRLSQIRIAFLFRGQRNILTLRRHFVFQIWAVRLDLISPSFSKLYVVLIENRVDFSHFQTDKSSLLKIRNYCKILRSVGQPALGSIPNLHLPLL